MTNGTQTSVTILSGQTILATLSLSGNARFCQITDKVLFASASSFVDSSLTDNVLAFQSVLNRLQAAPPGELLLVVGHTDDVGSPADNDPLSQRRADGVLAVLEGRTSTWEANYRTERSSAWSDNDFRTMLTAVNGTTPTQTEINQHKELSAAGETRRATLFTAYFQILLSSPGSPPIIHSLAPATLGCGERHTLGSGNHAPSRRAEFFFFRGASSPIVTCAEYPTWLTPCRILPPSSPTVTIAPVDTIGPGQVEQIQVNVTPSPLPLGATVTLELSTTSGTGEAVFADNGSSTIEISGSQAVRVRGVTQSSQIDNISISARHTGTTTVLASELFSVITTFFVSDTGDDITGTGSQNNPWRTIEHAIIERAAVSGPVIIGAIRGNFQESIELPSATTLKGLNTPLPTILGTLPDTATITVRNANKVKILNLGVEQGTGSGIRLENATDVEIDGCEIRENFGERGGGISVINSNRIDITNNEISENEGGDIASAITQVDLDVAILSGEIGTFEIDLGDAHGGGISLQNSSDVRIQNNRIFDNRAILFGGGIAVDNAPGFSGAIEISDNEIFCNQVSHGDISGLGGSFSRCSGADMGDPVLNRLESETLDFIAERAVRLLHGVGIESGLGGGIGLRHVTASTRVVRNLIGVRREGTDLQAAPNLARRGGGIEVYIGAFPHIELNTISFNLTDDDGAGIAIDQFDPFLPDNQTNFLGFSRGAMVPRQTINLVNNVLQFNRTGEDGGGIYATGNPIVNITGSNTLIEGNRAQENGGGIRVSYAARLTVRDARLINNQSNTDNAGREGGGGVAARNSLISFENCQFDNNRANAFAGGAVFTNSAFEGGFDAGGFITGEGQFDRIMERDYSFTTRTASFKNCSGTANQATGASGAGGFLYAVHVDGDQPLHVTIEGASTAIGTNLSEHANEGRRKRGNVVVEFDGQTTAAGLPADQFTIHGDVPAIPTGIANTTPAPDNRSVVFIPGGGATLDVHPTTFPFTNIPPRVQSLEPPFGAFAGGTDVTVRGTGFLPDAAVSFGPGNPAPIVDFISDTELRVSTPALPIPLTVNTVDVIVTNPDGQTHTLPDGFEYVDPPSITLVTPATGPFFGGILIDVEGTGFRDGLDLFIGSQLCVLISVTPTRITSELPAGPIGPADVSVINLDLQQDIVRGGFDYIDPPPPTISSIFPPNGTPTGGTPVAVNGTGFFDGAQVFFGSIPGTTTFVSDTELTAMTPATAPGTVDVTVVNPDGDSSPLSISFVYDPPPAVFGLIPSAAPSTGSTSVTISGSGFQPGVVVALSAGTISSVIRISDTEIELIVDGGPVGAVDLTVTNPDGQQVTIAGGFSFL